MAIDVVSEEELRSALAKWMLKNSRSCSFYKGGSADDFIKAFKLPDADYKLVSARTEYDGEPTAVFKAQIKLADWQTRGACEKVFEFYKLARVVPDSGGGFPNLETIGFIITAL
ncbi:MAG: hypothetical protein GX107_05110 [Clostridiales bacterium]|jgi:hypothetical protein|nr:hypothetical protein [Clostridiales bacterium]